MDVLNLGSWERIWCPWTGWPVLVVTWMLSSEETQANIIDNNIANIISVLSGQNCQNYKMYYQ